MGLSKNNGNNLIITVCKTYYIPVKCKQQKVRNRPHEPSLSKAHKFSKILLCQNHLSSAFKIPRKDFDKDLYPLVTSSNGCSKISVLTFLMSLMF